LKSSQGSISRITHFCWPEFDIRHYYVQNIKDGIQENVTTHFSQFISVKIKKNLRKSQAQFRKKLRTLRLRQNDYFLIKNRVWLK